MVKKPTGTAQEGIVKTAVKGVAAKTLQWGITAGLIACVLMLAFAFRKPIIGAIAQAFPQMEWPQSLQQLFPDEIMGFSSVAVTDAVIGESRQKHMFVVLEQDVQADSEISSALANLELFRKTKRMHFYGVGVYTVDLSQLTQDSIRVDGRTKTVTVTIPHAMLNYITVDDSKTQFEDTEHALFGFGEVKLTQEQQNELDLSIEKTMREILDTDAMHTKADKAAQDGIKSLFTPLVTAQAGAESLTVSIVFAPEKQP
ncbi:MAG: DUF4230 domain-containing protein [Ruthenibacterium sp.]